MKPIEIKATKPPRNGTQWDIKLAEILRMILCKTQKRDIQTYFKLKGNKDSRLLCKKHIILGIQGFIKKIREIFKFFLIIGIFNQCCFFKPSIKDCSTDCSCNFFRSICYRFGLFLVFVHTCNRMIKHNRLITETKIKRSFTSSRQRFQLWKNCQKVKSEQTNSLQRFFTLA